MFSTRLYKPQKQKGGSATDAQAGHSQKPVDFEACKRSVTGIRISAR